MSPLDGLDSARHRQGSIELFSTAWSSLLLRRFVAEATVDEFETPPVAQQLIVLLKSGGGDMQRFSRGSWQSVRKVPGSLTFTAPGESSRMRWSGRARHGILHVSVPESIMSAAAMDLRDRGLKPNPNPHLFVHHDPLVANVLLALEQAVIDGAPDLYAQSAAHFLAVHLLTRAGEAPAAGARDRDSDRLRRLDEFMRANLALPLSLTSLAAAVDCSPFRLIRLSKAGWGETPFQRLTRLRMERGQQLLRNTQADILTVAFECGYGNPSHFATAFRRWVGKSPSAFRRG